jgi:hypothetical protein
LGIGDWGLGIGDWGLGIGDWGLKIFIVNIIYIPEIIFNKIIKIRFKTIIKK